jgi:sulfite oxidase
MWGKRADMVVHERDPYNAEPPRHALAEYPITPADTFYSRNHGQVPVLRPEQWRLHVEGLVACPAVFSLDDLQSSFPAASVVATLQCAGNRRQGLIDVRDIPGEHPWGPAATSTAEWGGVHLRDVLAAAGVQTEAAEVAFEAPDVSPLAEPPEVYGGSIPLTKALAPEVLLAWSMNGEALTPVHGAPVRVVVPGYIGARSVKWVERIVVQSEPSANFFQRTAYRLLPPEGVPGPGLGVPLGALAVNSEILTPDDGEVLRVGVNRISGYALAGDDREIVRVDVSADGGRRWQQAELADQRSPWSWRFWSADVELARGWTQLVARAWDSSATLQPPFAEDVWNPKGYVNNSWARVDVEAR